MTNNGDGPGHNPEISTHARTRQTRRAERLEQELRTNLAKRKQLIRSRTAHGMDAANRQQIGTEPESAVHTPHQDAGNGN